MTKLIRKNSSGSLKTVLWCAEYMDGKTIRQKQFSIYDVPLQEIETIIMKEFRVK